LTHHEVFNQPEPLVDYNLFEGNNALRDALKLNAAARHCRHWPSGAMLAARRKPMPGWPTSTPQLRSHDRAGRRADLVEFTPATTR
jgi:putative acyl-CoA dehydrogenase